ncbi:hypothetical protein [Streptomyces sp. NPDC090798]|uniref:hypothetical protein n=1 Tax=Streptomyces sp. NPDC090798 TaxID=3365968 RepID=UPI003825DF4F
MRAADSPERGAIAELERLLPSWPGKIFVQVRLAFADDIDLRTAPRSREALPNRQDLAV